MQSEKKRLRQTNHCLPLKTHYGKNIQKQQSGPARLFLGGRQGGGTGRARNQPKPTQTEGPTVQEEKGGPELAASAIPRPADRSAESERALGFLSGLDPALPART